MYGFCRFSIFDNWSALTFYHRTSVITVQLHASSTWQYVSADRRNLRLVKVSVGFHYIFFAGAPTLTAGRHTHHVFFLASAYLSKIGSCGWSKQTDIVFHRLAFIVVCKVWTKLSITAYFTDYNFLKFSYIYCIVMCNVLHIAQNHKKAKMPICIEFMEIYNNVF